MTLEHPVTQLHADRGNDQKGNRHVIVINTGIICVHEECERAGYTAYSPDSCLQM